MKLPNEVLECVAFLCVERADGTVHYGGTGYFVNYPSPLYPQRLFWYFVTAKHSVERAFAEAGGVSIRLNRHDGGSEVFKPEIDQWHYPMDPGVDVAVLPWAPARDRFAVRHLAYSMLLTDDLAVANQIGPGEDVIVTGLFTQRAGVTRNRPIIRSGVLAAMADEVIPDSSGDYHAYLAEVRSIGGLSGSPVFVMLAPPRIHRGDSGQYSMRFDPVRFFLLGQIRGHWDYRDRSMQFMPNELKAVNMGMAIVTPAREVVALLNDPVLTEIREKTDADLGPPKSPSDTP